PVPHSQNPRRASHLLPPDRVHPRRILSQVSGFERRIQHAAPFAAGTRDHHHIVTVGDIPGHRGRALARLIVGMRVHRHHPKLLHGRSFTLSSRTASCEPPGGGEPSRAWTIVPRCPSPNFPRGGATSWALVSFPRAATDPPEPRVWSAAGVGPGWPG